MGTQGAGRKRNPNKERSTAEDDALNLIARELNHGNALAPLAWICRLLVMLPCGEGEASCNIRCCFEEHVHKSTGSSCYLSSSNNYETRLTEKDNLSISH
ncbi:hypothetical protein CRUP_003429 [Coryphaenoides rupestris]|nr:hypothetical protein CRUP_003429 [Coryphaenoides rupestris]